MRCPDAATAARMIRLVERTRAAGDSVGGIVTGVARGVPPGWATLSSTARSRSGESHAEPPASKGFEIGSGFGSVQLTGREHNDAFRMRRGRVRTVTNRSGGVQGGIANGETIYFRVAFKPVATVMHAQDTVDEKLQNTTIRGRGRHDPCVLPRAVRLSRR